MMGYDLIRKLSWLIIAMTCVCIGLDALGMNTEKLFHLQNYDLMVRYFVGCVGAGSLVMFFVERATGCCKK